MSFISFNEDAVIPLPASANSTHFDEKLLVENKTHKIMDENIPLVASPESTNIEDKDAKATAQNKFDACYKETSNIKIKKINNNNAVESVLMNDLNFGIYLKNKFNSRRKSKTIKKATVNVKKGKFEKVIKSKQKSPLSKPDKTFPSPQEKKHLNQNRDDIDVQDIVSCTSCKKGFKLISLFDSHKCEASRANINNGESKKAYECTLCDMTFVQDNYLQKHLLSHKRNKCKLCCAPFTKRKALYKHLRLVHNVSQPLQLYKCSSCEKSFTKKLSLYRHLKVHANGRLLCQRCGFMCDIETDYNIHLKEHQNVKLECTLCGQQFSRKQQYDQHMIGHEKHLCSICNSSFPIKRLLLRHQSSVHGELVIVKRHKCEICDKCFNRPKQLLLHQRTHTGEKPVQCSYCEKSFCTKRALSKHMVTARHLQTMSKKEGKPLKLEKRFLCDECGAKFYQQTSLARHLEQAHRSNESFKCSYCEYSTKNKANLQRHAELHTDNKRFICELCGSSFHALGTLKDHHTYVHSEDRTHICTLCDKGFKSNSSLKRHMRIHSEARPFKCHCDKAYKRMSHLKRHMAAVHNTKFKITKVQKITESSDTETSLSNHDAPPSLAETLELLQDHSSCDDFPLLLTSNSSSETNRIKEALISADVSDSEMLRASQCGNFVTVPSDLVQVYLNGRNEQIIMSTSKNPLMNLMSPERDNVSQLSQARSVAIEDSELNISPNSFRAFNMSTSPLNLITMESVNAALTDSLMQHNPLHLQSISSHESHMRPHSLPNLNLQSHHSSTDSTDSFPQFSLHAVDSPTATLSIPFLLNSETAVTHQHVSDIDLAAVEPMSPSKNLFGVSNDTLELSAYSDNSHLTVPNCKLPNPLSEDPRHSNLWISASEDSTGMKSTDTDVMAISTCSSSTGSSMSEFSTLLPQTLFPNDSLISCSIDSNSLNADEFESLAGLC